MRFWSMTPTRHVHKLTLLVLLGLTTSRSDASTLYTVTDLGAPTPVGSPAIPESLMDPKPSNASGMYVLNPDVRVGGPGPIISRAQLQDASGLRIQVGDLNDGKSDSYGIAINNAGQVVGRAITALGFDHAFLYTDGHTFDLNSLIVPSIPDASWTLTSAMNIDDNGRILAVGTLGQLEHELLLTPTNTPEPNTLALFGLVSVASGLRHFLRRCSGR